MSHLLDFLSNRGISPRLVARGENGPEYASPCPLCGGEDRFRVWPEVRGEKCSGRYWCRGCGKRGDTIDYLRQIEGCSYHAACARLGVALPKPRARRGYQHAPDIPTTQPWSPRVCPAPSPAWQKQARELLQAAQERLQHNRDALHWLSRRGITERIVRDFGLGFHESQSGGDSYRDRAAWGLPFATGKNGKPKRLWIPRGWVIPNFAPDGQLLQLRVRRTDADTARFAQNIRYLPVEGSSSAGLIIAPNAAAHVVVESGFDAILLSAITAGRVGAVCLWNCSARPDAATHAVLQKSMCILGALDFDDAGEHETAWWRDHYRRFLRLPALPKRCKDPGDAAAAGVDLYQWIRAALPTGLEIRLGMRAPYRAPRENPAQPEKKTCTEQQPAVKTVTRKNGTVIYLTENEAEWQRLRREQKPVFKQSEIAHLQNALKNIDENEREKMIDTIIAAKSIFSGEIVRGVHCKKSENTVE